MTKICVICKKEPVPGDTSRSFHRFPLNSELRLKWMEATKIEKISKVSTVCSDHFDYDSYHHINMYTKIRRLLSTAVPVFCERNLVSNQITSNKMLSLTKETDLETCLINDLNEHSFNYTTDLLRKTNNIVSEFSIQVDTFNCNNNVSQDLLTLPACDTDIPLPKPKGTETSNYDKIGMNYISKQSIIDECSLPKKKFCFMDGCQPSHISREDFVSNEAWECFIKLMINKKRKLTSVQKKCLRRGKQITQIKELLRVYN